MRLETDPELERSPLSLLLALEAARGTRVKNWGWNLDTVAGLLAGLS